MDFSSLTVFSCFLTPWQPFISPGPALGTACSPCSQGTWAGCEVGYGRTRPWQSISADTGCGRVTVTGGGTCRDRGQQASALTTSFRMLSSSVGGTSGYRGLGCTRSSLKITFLGEIKNPQGFHPL